MSVVTKIAPVLACVGVLTAGLLVAPQAQAYVPGPPCSGAGCLGKDPYTTVNRQGQSCASNSYWVRDKNNSTGYARATSGGSPWGAQLVYSPFCTSNWVEWVGSDTCGGQGLWYVEQNDGVKKWADGLGDNGQTSPWRSTMVNGTGVAQAAMHDQCDYTETWHYSGWF